MGFLSFLDKVFAKTEKVGFKVANVTHKVVVTGLFLTFLYGTYGLARDYRAYFLMRRDPKYKEYLLKREEFIRKAVEARNDEENKAKSNI
ncbi:unnamed protein product [Blepharisma stoltei]|uniref:Uncharacterized protein n=1 Tax=Blepharisma stoltei TaxID=1481888 RepID=A0AAU9JVE2_9CILI|nr:unnamed protein product [Blepharisma stoltei]